MAWGNSLIAIDNVVDAATTAQATPLASVPTQQSKPLFFDATLYDPRPEVTAAEAEEALAKFLETGNLYSVALHCCKSIETIERLFDNPTFKERLERAKQQLDNVYVVFAERTLFEIVNNKYNSEAARTRAAKAILDRYDRKQDIAALLQRLETLEAGRNADDAELPPHLRAGR